MARISRVGHVALSVRDVARSVDFFTQALGMQVTYQSDNDRAAFFSFGTQHHDIACFQAPEGAERGEVGLNHVALVIEGGLPELKALKERLEAHGVAIDDMVDHAFTKSVYFQDPDGNGMEIYAEGYEDPRDGVEAIKLGSSMFKPLELEG